MYNILVFCNKKSREIVIPEFKKYFDYIDESLHKKLNYFAIKRIVRENLDFVGSVFTLNVSENGLKIDDISKESESNPDSSFLFDDDKLITNYTEFTPFDKILSVIFEMSDLKTERNKVDKVEGNYNFGILNGQLIYHDDFGKTITKETEKTLHSFFKEGCFTNLFRIKF